MLNDSVQRCKAVEGVVVVVGEVKTCEMGFDVDVPRLPEWVQEPCTPHEGKCSIPTRIHV